MLSRIILTCLVCLAVVTLTACQSKPPPVDYAFSP